jgi:AcrR family transcriptional regulator
MSETSRRGPYSKGIAKREEILREALRAYSEADSSGPSLRAIAARVGLSERGLLHYFSSRDALLVAILIERDSDASALFDPDGPIEGLVGVQTQTSVTPGLVRLFLEMTVAAAGPNHAGHDYFTARYPLVKAMVARMFARSSELSGQPSRSQETNEFAARMLIAAVDGLQLQWLLDPSIDLETDLQRLGRLLRDA